MLIQVHYEAHISLKLFMKILMLMMRPLPLV